MLYWDTTCIIGLRRGRKMGKNIIKFLAVATIVFCSLGLMMTTGCAHSPRYGDRFKKPSQREAAHMQECMLEKDYDACMVSKGYKKEW